MAVFHPHTVNCACGKKLVVQLADSINVARSPEARVRILNGEMHRATCTACKRTMIVEKPFYYTDRARNAFFKVLPRGERHRWRAESAALERASTLVPNFTLKEKGRTLRVIFGMDELREKLMAQDANIDDRTIELLKALLVYEHPVLVRRPRLRLVFNGINGSNLQFRACYEHHQQRFQLAMPRSSVSRLLKKPEALKAWVDAAHPGTNILSAAVHWVNMWQWSPQPTALEQLRTYATTLRAGKAIDTAAPEFLRMLARLPRGNHLPSWAKQDLRTLYDYAKKKGLSKLEDSLFEIRFGIELDDDWSSNSDPNDIDTLWKLLRDLPDTNVEGNTKIHELLLDEGTGGGTYDPGSYDIAIGSEELAGKERFEDVVRHEVGHAVHEMKPKLVNTWLTTKFGWRVFGTSDGEIDAWISLMGGWGTLTAAQRREVRGYLVTALGNGSRWNPGPKPKAPANHPWNGATFGPRLAYEKSGANWFNNFKTWYRANGYAFYLNYWYQTLMVVSVDTLSLIAKMPDSYAAMSHFEFFAELYALYYDLDDPKRNVIPADVAAWLNTNIGAPEIAAPAKPARPERPRDWEGTKRPKAAKKRT